jgi:DNA-3-methyladenine glycosylase
VETEAYRAEGDPGSHAYHGLTPRNRVMYGQPGLCYVYFNYGCHWMLNVVAHAEGAAAAVLVRAAEPVAGLEEFRLLRPKAKHDWDLLSGPGKLAAGFGINGKDYGLDLLDAGSSLRLEPGLPPTKILQSPRVGLAAGKGEEIPWRFADGHALRFVSRPHPKESLGSQE